VAHAEASAKTVDAAVTAAAAQLGLRSDQVDVEVLDDPVPSTFGYIGSPARVRVTPRATAPTGPSGQAHSTALADSEPGGSGAAAARSPNGPPTPARSEAASGMGGPADAGSVSAEGRPGAGDHAGAEEMSTQDPAAAGGSAGAEVVENPAAETGVAGPDASPAPTGPDQAAATAQDPASGSAVTEHSAGPAASEVPPTTAPPSTLGIPDAAGESAASAISAGDGPRSPEDTGSSSPATTSPQAPEQPATAPDQPPSVTTEPSSVPGAALSMPTEQSSDGPEAPQPVAPQPPPAADDPAAAPPSSLGTAGTGEQPATGGGQTPDSSSPQAVSSLSSETKPSRRTYRDEPIDPEMVEVDTERAGDFLEGLLDALDVDGDITTWIDEVGGHIDLEGSDLNVLLGSNGETLDALQELTRLAVLRQSKRRVRLLLDINGFRVRQREQLTSLVRTTAEEVIRTRQEHEFQPMTPAERKVVHDAVGAIDGVSTESLGEEPNRRVIIRPT
jgi:spoIIIJ-associated protein